jgi:hypothetical protein
MLIRKRIKHQEAEPEFMTGKMQKEVKNKIARVARASEL